MDTYDLLYKIELEEGNYFGSPFSKGHHQIMRFSIEHTDSLELVNELKEFPPSYEQFDSLSNKLGNFVYIPTTCTQRLNLNTQNDFSVKGLI
ncbi:MAG: hypothetical protein MK105_19565 [Crocinitomicaceae bacterium]|nr:hypothetical protein [Crocinitomicaceae bacterium]